MTISDRSRKLLWGRSGNRCALCRRLLVMPGTESDRESIVGDECHIISAVPGGPRGHISEVDKPDEYANLILLCKVDHKRLDDQPNTFTADRLRALKLAHETWVQATLNVAPPEEQTVQPNDQHNRFRTTRIEGGSELLQIVGGCQGYDFDHDELDDETEVDTVSAFLQDLHDLGDLFDDMESGERVRTRYRLTQTLAELRELGFVVYGGRTRRVVVAGGKRMPFEVALVRVLKITNPGIWDPVIFEELKRRLDGEAAAESSDAANSPADR